MSVVGEGIGSGRAAAALPGPHPQARPGAWRAVLVALLVIATGDIAAVLTIGNRSARAGTSTVASADAGAGPAGARTEVAGPAPAVVTAAADPAGSPPPVSLAVPSLGLQTGLVDLMLEADRTLAAPDDAATAGWWSQGTVPGQIGPAVIVGHVDSRTGPGVFFRIHELRAGDPVSVTRSDGEKVTFVVDEVQEYPKAMLPTSLVYGPTPRPELRLITCGGRFDRRKGSYEANVVVFAHQASSMPTRRPA